MKKKLLITAIILIIGLGVFIAGREKNLFSSKHYVYDVDEVKYYADDINDLDGEDRKKCKLIEEMVLNVVKYEKYGSNKVVNDDSDPAFGPIHKQGDYIYIGYLYEYDMGEDTILGVKELAIVGARGAVSRVKEAITYIYKKQMVEGKIKEIPVGLTRAYTYSVIEGDYATSADLNTVFEHGEYNKGYYIDVGDFFTEHVKKNEAIYKEMYYEGDSLYEVFEGSFSHIKSAKIEKFGYVVFVQKKPQGDMSYIKANYCEIEEIYRRKE